VEDAITILIAALLVLATVVPYFFRVRRSEKEAQKRFEQLKVTGLEAANSMHPHINALTCIGCGGCVSACPEEGVLAVIDGKATLVHGAKCVGHGLCADACPVGAITLLMASPGRSADLPVLSEHLETNVKNMFIVGELGGLGLIKNAITQGRQAVEYIASRNPPRNGGYDVTIIGAGPAGLAAALTAKKHKLSYLLLEQGDVGGTILQYPRRKIVMTSPVEIPLWGKLKLTEASKESLLELWETILKKTDLHINTNEKVLEIQRRDGYFHVTTTKNVYMSSYVILALGRRGTPRKLGVPGEERSKVVYRLIDAETYHNCDVLVVGGGDSAVEAAVGLALQGTNRVTISYRKPEFTRLKDRNLKHLEDDVKRKKIDLIFNSEVKEILEHEVKLETPSGIKTLRNDYVFIFAGGEMPFDFLKKVGIQFQTQVVQ
jgi:putative YpdA family bacillithiol system oxidoreductase